MSLSDLYIQKKIQGGDIREFERLFAKYYGPLCHHAHRIVNDMDAAEDLVSEFFYNFWKNRERFTPRLSLNAYLYRSVQNNAVHYLEHLAIRRKYEENVIREFRGAPASGLMTDTEMDDLGKVIEETLRQMPERCSRIFRMNRFEGKKYRDIAEILSISVKTVEADMGKALEMFRKTLKDYTGEAAGFSR